MRGGSFTTDVFIFVTMERKGQTGKRRQTSSSKLGRERQTRWTEEAAKEFQKPLRAGTKRVLIGQSEAVNERGRRRRRRWGGETPAV